MTTHKRRPLWRLLLALKKGKSSVEFDCDECFRLLEYLAEIRAANTISETRYLALIRQHLSICPGCREHYAEMLRQLEQALNSSLPVTP